MKQGHKSQVGRHTSIHCIYYHSSIHCMYIATKQETGAHMMKNAIYQHIFLYYHSSI
jgi:hypothetical protein